MNLAAVIQRRELLTERNSVEYIAWMYDKDRIRNPEGDEMSRYHGVGFLGPFRSKDMAITAAEDAIERGFVA